MYPKSICQLKDKYTELKSRWESLHNEITALEGNLRSRSWGSLLKAVCKRAEGLLDLKIPSQHEIHSISICFDIVERAAKHNLLSRELSTKKNILQNRWIKFKRDNGMYFTEMIPNFSSILAESKRFSALSFQTQSTGDMVSTFSSPSLSTGCETSPSLRSSSPISKANSCDSTLGNSSLTNKNLEAIPKVGLSSINNEVLKYSFNTFLKKSELAENALSSNASIRNNLKFSQKLKISKPKLISIVTHEDGHNYRHQKPELRVSTSQSRDESTLALMIFPSPLPIQDFKENFDYPSFNKVETKKPVLKRSSQEHIASRLSISEFIDPEIPPYELDEHDFTTTEQKSPIQPEQNIAENSCLMRDKVKRVSTLGSISKNKPLELTKPSSQTTSSFPPKSLSPFVPSNLGIPDFSAYKIDLFPFEEELQSMVNDFVFGEEINSLGFDNFFLEDTLEYQSVVEATDTYY